MFKTKIKIAILAIFIFAGIFGILEFSSAAIDGKSLQPAYADRPASELLRIYKNKKDTSVYVFKNNVKWHGAGSFTKSLTVGTTKNKGVLYIQGVIKNPDSGKKVVINDSLTVKGNLKISGGVLQGSDVVSTSNLSDSAITAAKIAQGAVTSDKILAGAVLGEKIADGTITGSDISSSAELSITSLSASGGVAIGGGEQITKHYSLSSNLDAISFGSTTECATANAAKSNIAIGDRITASPAPTTNGVEDDNYMWNAYVGADNAITLKVCRPTTGSVATIAAQTWYFDIWR